MCFRSDVESRAYESTVDSLKAYGRFGIAAYLNDSDHSLYFKDEITYSNNSWSSDNTHYWSVMYGVDFYAYSPIEDFIVVSNGGDYSLTYTCPAEVDDQIDLLVETLKDQYGSADGSVNLDFNHALSSIKFQVEFSGEPNVSLNYITINYMYIEKERTYNFGTETWDEPETPIYFDNSETPVLLDDLDKQIMIIPQSVNTVDKDDLHYISVSISYVLVDGSLGDDSGTEVMTGVMQLPPPTVDGEYLMGKVYTYKITVNEEILTIGEATITDSEEPQTAYGNIDLGLITEYMTPAEIGYTGTDEVDAQFYYTTAQRVKTLLLDDVRDFVVVGSMGASDNEGENTLGNGKLGFYGSTSSPFYIGSILAGLNSNNSSDYYSIDLRGTFDYPRFADANNDTTADDDTSTVSEVSEVEDDSDNTIGADEPILIAGLFAEIDWLDEVILPNGIAAIGNHAFASCGALRTIDLAEIEHIEIGAFQDCENLETVENGALTRVHDHGFDSCVSLTTIDLSKVTEIDTYGFVDCENLTNVNLTNLKDIGIHAFNGCTNLTLVEGSELQGFTTVEDYAFSGCTRLGENGGSKINLDNATSVGNHSFAECEHIELSSGDLDDLLSVGVYAFNECTALGAGGQELSIPNLVKIDTASFTKCVNLNIVDGLENLETIPYYAFQYCEKFTGYSSSDEDKVLSLPKVTRVDGYAFDNTAVTSVSFSDKLTYIGEYAFSECGSLTTLSGMESVETVGYSAFSNCYNLEILELPKMTGEVSGWYFSGYSNLHTANFASATSVGNGAFQYCVSLTSLDLSSATYVGTMAFQGCSMLEELILPKVTSFGPYLFSGCSSLRVLQMDALETQTSEEYKSDSGTTVTENIFEMVQACTNLEELYLPSVEADSFGGYQYYNNTSLAYLDLASVKEVVKGTFADNNIVAVDLRSAITVDSMAFQNCESLKRINLSSVETVRAWAFADIENTDCEIWLPESQQANVTGTTTWQGKTWGAIHYGNDGFYLKSE